MNTVSFYDADGNILSIVNLAPDGKTVQSSYVYTYNSQNLPVTMTTSSGTFAYSYDANGQLISVRMPSGQTITYQYDAAGNRVAVVSGGTPTNYTANSLNQYTAVGNATYQYDANGDLISSTDSSGKTNYSYNALGQLVGVVSPTDTTTYQYDALGQMVSENVNGAVTNLLNDPTGLGNVVGQFSSGGNPIAQYAYGLGLVSQATSGGANNFYSFDITGNTTQLTGPTGGVLNTYSYLPFGESLSATGSTPNPFTYVGQLGVMNDTSGLEFMRNRWYDPALGRFTSPDPTGLGGKDTNLYRYVFNSPTQLVDPNGLQPNPFSGANPNNPSDLALQNDLNQGATNINAGAHAASLNGFTSGNQNSATTETTGVTVAGYGVTDSSVAVSTGGTVLSATSSAAVGIVFFAGEKQQLNAVLDSLQGQPPQNQTSDQSSQTSPDAIASGITNGSQNDLGPAIRANRDLGEPPDQAILHAMQTTGVAAVSHGGTFKNVDGQLVFVPLSHDPNEITGPAGFGTQGFVSANTTLPYRIDFTNEANATAPADVVTVTQQLDPSLDLSTFQLGDLGFGNTIIHVPAGLTSYSTTVNLPSTAPGAGPNGLEVEINASLNTSTGLVTWTFTGIDPTTQDIPIDPLVGFLPPDATPPEGEGFVSYTIKPKSTVTTSTVINAQATVVFDQNAPINTKQISNTLDPVAPTSSVNPLPATTASPTFNVSWSGQDDAGGSGIASFSVFVSDNGGNFTPLLSNTKQTSTTFTGQVGHTYQFFSVATDNVGNLQPLPAAPQATISIVQSPPATSTPPSSPTPISWLDSVYLDLLNRPLDSSGLATWTNLLNGLGNTSAARTQVIEDIEASVEYRSDEVNNLYLEYLKRPASGDPGAQTWVNQLGAGASLEQVAAQIAASPEFIANQTDGSFGSWLTAVYHDALRRPVDPSGLATWTALSGGGTSRAQIAQDIFSSYESRLDLVNGYYELLLARSAFDDAGSLGWVSSLQDGATDQEVMADIAASQEFYNKSV